MYRMAHTNSVRLMAFLSIALLTTGYVLAAGVGYYNAISIWYSIPAIAGLVGGGLLSVWTVYLFAWKTAYRIRRIARPA